MTSWWSSWWTLSPLFYQCQSFVLDGLYARLSTTVGLVDTSYDVTYETTSTVCTRSPSLYSFEVVPLGEGLVDPCEVTLRAWSGWEGQRMCAGCSGVFCAMQPTVKTKRNRSTSKRIFSEDITNKGMRHRTLSKVFIVFKLDPPNARTRPQQTHDSVWITNWD